MDMPQSADADAWIESMCQVIDIAVITYAEHVQGVDLGWRQAPL